MAYSYSYFGKLSLVLATAIAPALGFAAGFEKSILWSGKNTGRANAVVGDVTGAESLFFNPSGLAVQKQTGEVSLNFSPTLSNFEGSVPFFNASPIVEGRQQFSPVFGGMAGFKVTEKLGLGAGLFVSGGTRARFPDLNYAALNPGYITRPTVETNLSITEASLGAGYEILPRLRVGLAWRYVMVKANFALVSNAGAPGAPPASTLLNVSANDLEAKRWNGFRLGAQYASEDNTWGVGSTFRSSVKFTAKGTTSGRVDFGNGTAAPIVGGPVDVTNTFPLQLAVGGFYQVTERLRVSPEYSFSNYTKDDALDLGGSFTAPLLGVRPLADVQQNWKNQHVGRLGLAYAVSEATTARAGYAYTSQVTPDERARNSFASPGAGHTLTVGAGHSCMNEMLDLDIALEHSFASGSGKNAAEAIGTDHDYSSKAYALHTGVTYRF